MTAPVTTVGEQLIELVRRRETRRLELQMAREALKAIVEKLPERQDCMVIKEDISAMDASILRLARENGGQQVVDIGA